MEKRKTIILGLLVSSSLCVASLVAIKTLGSKELKNASANDDPTYSINLFNSIKDNVSSGTATINTHNGNAIVVSFSGLSVNDNKLVFAANGYIKNETALTGTAKMTSDFVGDVSYWNKDEMLVIHDKIEGGSLLFDPSIVASYFEIVDEDGGKEMTSLSIGYECDQIIDNGSLTLGYNPSKTTVDYTNKSFVGSSDATLTMNATLSRGHVRYKQNNNGQSASSGLVFNLSYTSSYFWKKASGADYFNAAFSSGRISLANVNATLDKEFAWYNTTGIAIPGYDKYSTYTIDIYFDISTGYFLGLVDGLATLRYTIPEEDRCSGNKLGFKLYTNIAFSDIEIFKNFEFDYESSFNESATEQALPSEWGSGPYGQNETKTCSNGELVIGNTTSGHKSVLYTGGNINVTSMIIEADVRLLVATQNYSAFGFVFSSSLYNESTGASTQLNYVRIARNGANYHGHYFSKLGSDYDGSTYVTSTGEKTVKSGTTITASNHEDIYNAINGGEIVHIVASISSNRIAFFIDGVELFNSTVDAGVDNYRVIGFYSAGNYTKPAYSNVKMMNV